jgi:hypothetical protein
MAKHELSESSPSNGRSDDPGRGDWLLDHLVSTLDEAVEDEGKEIWVSVALVVGGTLITGLAGNAVAWLSLQASTLRNTSAGDEKGLAFLELWAQGLDQIRSEMFQSGPRWPADFLHLRDVTVFRSGGVSQLGFLRVRLDQVAAWHLGRPT